MNAKMWMPMMTLAALLFGQGARAGLVHRYLMDDGSGTVVRDSIATADGTAKSLDGGTGTWTTGKFGGAWSSTTSGFLSFPSTGIPATQGSYVQWVKIATSAGNWSNPLATHVQDPDHPWQNPMRVEITDTGRAYLYGIPNGQPNGNDAFIGTTTVIRDNRWHQIVTTYDAAANKTAIYVDGVLRGSGIYNTNGLVTRSTWRLGRREETSGGRAAADYDNTAVYDYVLSAAEVNELFYRARDGVSLDTLPEFPRGLRHLYTFGPESHPTPGVVLDSWDHYDGMVTGGTWVADSPPKNAGGWRKTADNDLVQLPMRVNLVEGTYEGWFKTDPSTPDWQNPLATSIRDVAEAHAGDSMRIEVVTSAQYGPALMVYDAPGAGSFGTTAFSTADGQWHHLALTYKDGDLVRLYVDGQLAAASTANYSALAAIDRGFTMLGARDPGSTRSWRGTVGTVAYYDVALPDFWILEHYRNGIGPVPEPSSVLLLGLAGFGLAASAWKRRGKRPAG